MNNDSSSFKKGGTVLHVVMKEEAPLDVAIREAIYMSRLYKIPVSFQCDGIEITVNQESSLEDVYLAWENKKMATESYTQSHPEFAMAKDNAQRNLDQLLASMDKIDFTNLEQVIPYLSQILKCTNVMGTHFDRALLDQVLTSSGYSEGMNVGKINPNDKDAVGKWLVGQYLHKGSVSISPYLMDGWVEKFASKEQEKEKER